MTAENTEQSGPQVRSPILLSPWLVFAVSLVFYALTLNHWLTFASVPLVAQITGWNWHPEPLLWRPSPSCAPLTFILTYPLRLFPADSQVVWINFFMSVCAAGVLGILARSIRLLSHDRSPEQRQQTFSMLFANFGSVISHNKTLLFRDRGKDLGLQETSAVATLPVRASFLAVGLAVLLLGAQMTFWENAITGTGEMIDLVIFAFLILCLLEFRVSQKNHWLYLCAFAYGAGLTNNWSLFGFAPLFLVCFVCYKLGPLLHPPVPQGGYAAIWFNSVKAFKTRAANIFGVVKTAFVLNWRFLLVCIVLFLLGLSFYALLPAMGAARHEGTFAQLLHERLATERFLLRRIPRYYFAIAGLPTLIPLLMAFSSWPAFKGDFGTQMDIYTRLILRLMHLAFLLICVAMFFDIDLSSSPRARFGLGVNGPPTFLSFYYLAALSVGYYFGHLFFFFGKDIAYNWGQDRPILRKGNAAFAVLLGAGAIVAPAILMCTNLPHIRDFNKPVVAEFGNEMAKGLPAKPGFVLADDSPILYLAMDARRRLHLPDQYIFIESQELNRRDYLQYLARRYPTFSELFGDPARFPEELTDQTVGAFLAFAAQRKPVYYLHPSFGNRFERVFMVPHDLGGIVLPDPSNALKTLMLSLAEVATNQAFWHRLEKGALASLPELSSNSANARLVANCYSQSLDYWGTELQKSATALKLSPEEKAAMLNDAGDQFGEALALNPDNFIARANQQFNARLRGAQDSNKPINIAELAAPMYYQWGNILSLYGPPDTPELNNVFGEYFAVRQFFVQAAHMFQRALELAPHDPEAELNLARTYIELNQPGAALALAREAKEKFAGDPHELIRVEALAYATKNDFAAAEKLLTDEHSKDPSNEKFDGVMAEFYMRMGYTALRTPQKIGITNADEGTNQAASWFRKGLASLNEQLYVLATNHADQALVSSAAVKKAEAQMALKDYQAAVSTISKLMVDDPSNNVARLDRAISEFELQRYDAASDDFRAVESSSPNPAPVIYSSLAKIAKARNDKETEIHYDKLLLDRTPAGTVQYTNASNELKALEGK